MIGQNKTLEYLCECDSTCMKTISITIGDALEHTRLGLVVISSDCKTGPEPSDTFVERRDGYSVYRPQ